MWQATAARTDFEDEPKTWLMHVWKKEKYYIRILNRSTELSLLNEHIFMGNFLVFVLFFNTRD